MTEPPPGAGALMINICDVLGAVPGADMLSRCEFLVWQRLARAPPETPVSPAVPWGTCFHTHTLVAAWWRLDN